MTDKVRENRIRRALARRQLSLAKSRSRSWDDPCFGKYHVFDDRNTVVAGATFQEFDMTLDEVDKYIDLI